MDKIKSAKGIEKEIAPILLSGGVGVLPTDTLYGLVGSALNEKAVKRIYDLRNRDLKKPLIILIGKIDDLALFNVKVDSSIEKFLESVWPGKVSVVLDCDSNKFEYLHRRKKTLAFRMPEEKWLRSLLKKTGPLVAPSANFEGAPSSLTIEEAKKYFDDKVDFYVDCGKMKSLPSTLVRLENGKAVVLRDGEVKIKI